jgi:hypothetical protein
MSKTFAQLASFPVQFPKKDIEVPELEMKLRIKTLTGLEHKKFVAEYKPMASEAETAALLVSIAVEDEDGQSPPFDMAISWPVALLKRLGEAVNEFNGFSAKTEEQIEKN